MRERWQLNVSQYHLTTETLQIYDVYFVKCSNRRGEGIALCDNELGNKGMLNGLERSGNHEFV